MHLDCASSSSYPTNAVLDAIGSCRLFWITAGGWALSMDLGQTRIPTVHHAPPETQTRSFDGVVVSTTTKKFSSPSDPVVTASSSEGSLVWHMVPPATHILPHHDKRVCQQQEQRQFRIGNEVQLACMMMMSSANHNNSCAPTTSLQHVVNLKRPPKALAIHRSNEWMLVATESSSKLLVYNARPPLPDRSRPRRLAGPICRR